MALDNRLKNLLKSASRKYREKNYETALRHYKSVFYQTKSPDLMYKVAMCCKKKKEYPKAVEYFSQLQKLPKFQYRAVHHQADIFYDTNEYKNALQYFNLLFKLNKKISHHKIYTKKGVCLYNLNRYKSALKCFETALKKKKESAYFYNVGCVLYQLKRYDEALDNACSAIQLDKDYANCYRLIGNIFYSKKEFKKAIDFAEKSEIIKEENDVKDFIADNYAQRKDYITAIRRYMELYEKNYESKKMISKIMQCFSATGNENMRNICVSHLADQMTGDEFKAVLNEELGKLKPTEIDYQNLWEWMKKN